MNEVTGYCGGTIVIVTKGLEPRMSHWVHVPRVTRPDGRVILDLTNTVWDLEYVVESAVGVALTVRNFPGDSDARAIQIIAASGDIHLDDVAVRADELERRVKTGRSAGEQSLGSVPAAS